MRYRRRMIERVAISVYAAADYRFSDFLRSVSP
jgi:hypothetical protein